MMYEAFIIIVSCFVGFVLSCLAVTLLEKKFDSTEHRVLSLVLLWVIFSVLVVYIEMAYGGLTF